MENKMVTNQDNQSSKHWLKQVLGMLVSISIVILMIKATGGLNHEPLKDYSIHSIEQEVVLDDQGLIKIQEVVDLDIREDGSLNYAIQLNNLELSDLQVTYLAQGQKGETTEFGFSHVETETWDLPNQGHRLTQGQEVGPDSFTLTQEGGRALIKFQPDNQAENHYLYLNYYLSGGLFGHQDVALLDWQLLGNSIVTIGRYQARIQLPESAGLASQAWLTEDKEVLPLTIDSQSQLEIPAFTHNPDKLARLQVLLPLTSFKQVKPAAHPLSLSQLQDQIHAKKDELVEENKKNHFYKILLISLLFPLPFIKVIWDYLKYQKAYKASRPLELDKQVNQLDLPEQMKPGQVLGSYYNFVNQPGASLISTTLMDLLMKGYANLSYLPTKKTLISRKGDGLVVIPSSKDQSQLSQFETCLLEAFQFDNRQAVNFQTMIRSLPKQADFRFFQKDNLARLNKLKETEFLPQGHQVIDTNKHLHGNLLFTSLCWIPASGIGVSVFFPSLFILVISIALMAGLMFYLRDYYNQHPLLPEASHQDFQAWQAWASQLEARDLSNFKLEDLAYAAIYGQADQVQAAYQRASQDLGPFQVLSDHGLKIQDLIEIVDNFFSRVEDIRPDGTYPSD